MKKAYHWKKGEVGRVRKAVEAIAAARSESAGRGQTANRGVAKVVSAPEKPCDKPCWRVSYYPRKCSGCPIYKPRRDGKKVK